MIELNWQDAEQSVILGTLRGKFGIDHYAVLEGQLPMMVREVNHRVDVILQLTRGATFPRTILREIRILVNVMPPNFGIFVGVGSNFLLTNPLTVAGAGLLLHGLNLSKQVCVAGSVQRAHDCIVQRRQAQNYT